MIGIGDGDSQVARSTRGTVGVGAGVQHEPPKHYSVMQFGFRSARWNGVVIFRSERGKRVTDITGTPTGYLQAHISDDQKGVVEFCDGTLLEAWPDGCEVHDIADIAGALYVG